MNTYKNKIDKKDVYLGMNGTCCYHNKCYTVLYNCVNDHGMLDAMTEWGLV